MESTIDYDYILEELRRMEQRLTAAITGRCSRLELTNNSEVRFVSLETSHGWESCETSHDWEGPVLATCGVAWSSGSDREPIYDDAANDIDLHSQREAATMVPALSQPPPYSSLPLFDSNPVYDDFAHEGCGDDNIVHGVLGLDLLGNDHNQGDADASGDDVGSDFIICPQQKVASMVAARTAATSAPSSGNDVLDANDAFHFDRVELDVRIGHGLFDLDDEHAEQRVHEMAVDSLSAGFDDVVTTAAPFHLVTKPLFTNGTHDHDYAHVPEVLSGVQTEFVGIEWVVLANCSTKCPSQAVIAMSQAIVNMVPTAEYGFDKPIQGNYSIGCVGAAHGHPITCSCNLDGQGHRHRGYCSKLLSSNVVF